MPGIRCRACFLKASRCIALVVFYGARLTGTARTLNVNTVTRGRFRYRPPCARSLASLREDAKSERVS